MLLSERVRNLVDNALKYTPTRGSVTLRVLNDPFGQVVVLQVEDSGSGIVAAEREQIFQPFYLVLSIPVDASGLGLTIVSEIATQHEAEINVTDAQPHLRALALELSDVSQLFVGAKPRCAVHAALSSAPGVRSVSAEDSANIQQYLVSSL